MINYSLRLNLDEARNDRPAFETEHEVAIREAQVDRVEALKEAIEEDRKELIQKLEELFRRSDETISEPLDPLPVLAPDATIEEVIEAVNKAIYYINSRMTDDS